VLANYQYDDVIDGIEDTLEEWLPA